MVEEYVTRVVLTKPLLIEEEESESDFRAPNLLRRILSLFKNIRPGSDLTRFQIPPVFNIPKSHLQCLGESVYCCGSDLLSKCNQGESPLQRFVAVLAWSISIARPVIFGVAPYNPILGETHHVSWGDLNVLLEQVSHHPPVTALHATNARENLELIWCNHIVPKFLGASVEAEVHGKRKLKLLNHGETYVMNSPKLVIKYLPVTGVDWVGSVRIRCQETGLEAELCYQGSSFLGRKGRSIKGKIFESSSLKNIYEVSGHWDKTISMKDLNSGKVSVIHDAKEVLLGLKTPILKDLRGVWASESAAVWNEVSRGILSHDWEKAREAKSCVEEMQRELVRKRAAIGETWVPKHFNVCCSKEVGWECSPNKQWVPPAPIIVPH